MPSSMPQLSVTGTAEMPRSASRRAIAIAGVSAGIEMTFRVMTSRTCMALPFLAMAGMARRWGKTAIRLARPPCAGSNRPRSAGVRPPVRPGRRLLRRAAFVAQHGADPQLLEVQLLLQLLQPLGMQVPGLRVLDQPLARGLERRQPQPPPGRAFGCRGAAIGRGAVQVAGAVLVSRQDVARDGASQRVVQPALDLLEGSGGDDAAALRLIRVDPAVMRRQLDAQLADQPFQ